MQRYIFLVVAISLSALSMASFLDGNPQVVDTAATVLKDRAEQQSAHRSTASQKRTTQSYSGTERLHADSRGHYVAEFSLNSRRVTGVVDTGATLIAMNRSQARSIGISVRPSEFVYGVNTANGTVKAARAIVREVRIGTIRVREVEAIILEDEALDTVLIGMSFLKRLRDFRVTNGTLEMTL